jgi:hypothetical protein
MNIFVLHDYASRVEPGYNYIGLYDTSPTESDVLWYKIIRHC